MTDRLPVSWDQAPLGIFGIAIWSSTGQQRAAARITTALPFVYALLPCRIAHDLPDVCGQEVPAYWRPFTDQKELHSFQILIGSELCDLDGNTYWIRNDDNPGEGWIKVSKQDWIHHERLCHFFPKTVPSTDPDFRRIRATAGFTGGGPAGRFTGTYTTDGKMPPSWAGPYHQRERWSV